MISVVVPAYNAQAYIAQALESVLKQTYRDFEIIVVDDGSTDSTRTIVMEYAQGYPGKIRYVWQRNAGEGAARNRGIRESTGGYIAFLDADDIWLPEKLAQQCALLDSLADKKVVIYGDEYIFEDNRITVRSMFSQRPAHRGQVYEKLLYENFVTTQTVLVERSLFDRAGYFSEGMRFCSDFEMWLRLAKCCEFHYVHGVVAGYRMHSDQVSSDVRTMRDSALGIIQRALIEDGADKHCIEQVLSYQHFNYGCDFWKRGMVADARCEFYASWKHRFTLQSAMFLMRTFLPGFLRLRITK